MQAAVGGGYIRALLPTMLGGRRDEHPTEFMDLLGARLAFVEETGEGHRLDIVKLKKYIGTERITARRMRQDPAYCARAHRAHLRGRGVTTVIPESADQAAHRRRRGGAGGRPVSFDPDAYRGRNVIERAFNRLKNWRALATRYNKLATIYRGGLVLAAVLMWLRP